WEKGTIDPLRRQRYLRSTSEMTELFSSFWPEVIHETESVKEKCTVTLEFDQKLLPRYPVPEELDAHTYLEKWCWKNVEKKYSKVTEKVASRLQYELDVIQSMQYSDYFLIVWDFIMYAKQKQIL